MTSDPSLFLKRIRHLSQALMISGALNIVVLSLFIYWMMRERPPTPYCELKPASLEQQQIPLADHRGCAELLAQLSQLTFPQLINRLSQTQLIENGYAERDLALACMAAFHHFDVQRALPKDSQPKQRRLLAWKRTTPEPPITLAVYPDLTSEQFESLIRFAKTERWPFTAEGLFLLLQKQKKDGSIDKNLTETFMLTPEFWTVELLFNRSGQTISKEEILTLLQEGEWLLLKRFVEHQRQLHDQSDARRQKFLLDYLNAGSPMAAMLLLKTEWDFSVKKLDDAQVTAILTLLPASFKDGNRFAKEMLTSPRSTTVWQQSSHWLFKEAGETLPKEWNYQVILARFAPEKLKSELKTSSSSISSASPSVTPKVVSTPIISSRMPVAMSPPLRTWEKPKPEKKVVQPVKQPARRSYTVQEGDTLWKISRRFGVDVKVLKERNGLKTDAIKPGTILQVPQ